MMKKKHWVILSVVLLVLAWASRFVYLNLTTERQQIQTYAMGETVEYGDDFFYRSDEKRRGYKIVVHSAEKMSYEEFAEKQNLTLPPPPSPGDEGYEYFFRADIVYDVRVTIINEGNTQGNIDMFDTLLSSGKIRMRVDETLWDLLYPQLAGSYSFKARENTQMDFHFPFVLESKLAYDHCGSAFLKSKSFQLSISQYPIKKIIEVKL